MASIHDPNAVFKGKCGVRGCGCAARLLAEMIPPMPLERGAVEIELGASGALLLCPTHGPRWLDREGHTAAVAGLKRETLSGDRRTRALADFMMEMALEIQNVAK
jgi:hypothetical protein